MTWLEFAALDVLLFIATVAHGSIVNRRVREARREVHAEWMEWLRGQRR